LLRADKHRPRNDINNKGKHIMNENIFRILAAVILFTGIGISSYFRRKADIDSGEKISRKVDGTVFMTIIRIGYCIHDHHQDRWSNPLA
jgi:hypothetical protein